MVTAAIFAHGTLLKIGDGAGSEVFTTIAEVKNISGPGLKLNTVEATNHDSPNKTMEVIAGLIDPGEVSFDINYQPTAATHNVTTGLIRDLKNRTKRNFQLVFPDSGSTTWAFAAFVTEFNPQEPVNNVLNAQVKLKITGLPTLV